MVFSDVLLLSSCVFKICTSAIAICRFLHSDPGRDKNVLLRDTNRSPSLGTEYDRARVDPIKVHGL